MVIYRMPNQDANNLLHSAILLEKQHKLLQAIKKYKQLITLFPQHALAWNNLGLVYAQLGKFKKSIDCLQRALKINPHDFSLHMRMAKIYKKQQHIPQAIEHYKAVLNLDAANVEAHYNLAVLYSKFDYRNALQHYYQALKQHPDCAVLHFNLGLLFLKHKELHAAKTQFKNVLALQEDHLKAHFYLGILHLDANSLEEAKVAFLRVLELNKNDVESLNNLGVIALKNNLGQLAIDYFTKVLTIDNNHIEARNNLAATFMHYDRFENALMHYDVLLKQDPLNIEYLYNSGVAQMTLGHLDEAIANFSSILQQQPKYCAALQNLASIYIRLEQRKKAQKYLEQAVAVNPHDASSQHMLRAITGDQTNPETCPQYAANLFNNYALYYDQHVSQQLAYALPQHIKRILGQLNIIDIEKALDLGCGTGLCGEVLCNITKKLHGIDIAPKMLEQAKKKHIYGQLTQADLLEFIQQDYQHYQLILAADVLPYIGDLENLLKNINHRLTMQGYFIFTVEISENKPWQLLISGRFSHQKDYIEALLNKYKFIIVHKEQVIARLQNKQPVPELIYVVQKID